MPSSPLHSYDEVEVPPPRSSHAISQLSDPPSATSPKTCLEKIPDVAVSSEGLQTRTGESKRPWWLLQPDGLSRKSHRPAVDLETLGTQASASAAIQR